MYPHADANFWVALTAVGGVLALIAAFVAHLVRLAYKHGQTDQRLSHLEVAVASAASLAAAVEGVRATVEGLKDSIDRLDRVLERLEVVRKVA